jgi:hypothetical protein
MDKDTMKALREVDVNELFEEFDEQGYAIDCINGNLILDYPYGNQDYCTGILEGAGFYNISNDELEACEAGIRASLQSVNYQLERMDLGLEVVQLDLTDTTSWMIVPAGASPKKIVKSIIKRLTEAA